MNHNLKKRRAFCHEDAPATEDLTSPRAVGLETLPLSADYRYILEAAPETEVSITIPLSNLLDLNRPEHQHMILEQAAATIGVPLSILLDLSQRQQHKRPRLNTNLPMPASSPSSLSSQDRREKAALDVEAGLGSAIVRKSLSDFTPDDSLHTGWTGARLADCFASFSVCQPCPPYEPQQAYQPLPPTSSYSYESQRMLALDNVSVVSIQPQSQPSLIPAPMVPDPAGFPCDDSALVQYMSNYPPLQPTRVMGMQPATSREEMVYPTRSPAVKYDSPTDGARIMPGISLPTQPFLSNTPIRTGPPVPGAYGAGDSSPSLTHHNSFVAVTAPPSQPPPQPIPPPLTQAVTPRYQAIPGLEVKDEPDAQGPPGGATSYDIFPTHRTVPARRGPFKDHDQREKTARTRKIGSCIRCRMQRIRCHLDPADEKGVCLSCQKIGGNCTNNGNKIYRLTCLRWKMTDVRLFKPGQVAGQEWTMRWKDSVVDDIGNWASSVSRTIRVTEGYTGSSVQLQVRQFRPQEGDKLQRTWVSNGVKHAVDIPAYAIVDMQAAKGAFDEYIKNGVYECCRSLLGATGKLLWQTYMRAMGKMSDPRTTSAEQKVIKYTLDLWMSVRLTTKSFEIIGDDTLDMPRDIIKDKNNALYGKIPIPPVMGAQIDSVLIHQIQPGLRRETLEKLQKMTQDKKTATWFTTYLVTFILLHNIGLVTRHDAEYAKKHGLKRRFARESFVKEYNVGANTLLAYFHYCNKGTYPFSAECRDQDLSTLAQLDEGEIEFVRYTRQFVGEHHERWQGLWRGEEYEDEFYYVSQLYEQNWQPRIMA